MIQKKGATISTIRHSSLSVNPVQIVMRGRREILRAGWRGQKPQIKASWLPVGLKIEPSLSLSNSAVWS